MPTLLEDVPRVGERPRPLSHDSSQEHSLDHWLEVYWMVEEDYLFSGMDQEHDTGGTIPKRPAKSAAHHHKSALHR
jgi:hypothetical protein